MKQRSVLWSELRAPELREMAKPETIVIVPVGSIEQHGPHLPVQTDTILAREVARRAAEQAAISVPVLVTEAIWLGLSEHHMALGGTLTSDFDTLFRSIRSVAQSLKRHGFERILLLNGHGGNAAALKMVVEMLTLELGLRIVEATYWQLAQHKISALLRKQKSVRHACEAETAMMLALRPDLVDASVLGIAGHPDKRDLGETVDDGYRWESFSGKTPTGVLGEPAAADAEQGEELLQTAASYLASRLGCSEFWGDST